MKKINTIIAASALALVTAQANADYYVSVSSLSITAGAATGAETTVYAGTLTDTGLLSWAGTHNDITWITPAATGNAERLADLRSDLPIWSINSFAQYFLEEMGDYQWAYTESCRQVRQATRRLVQGLEEVPYLHPYPTQGNFILLRILYGFTGEELETRLFEDCRVLVNNCGSKEGLGGEFIRVACRTEEDNDRLVEAFMRLAKFTESGRLDAVQTR